MLEVPQTGIDTSIIIVNIGITTNSNRYMINYHFNVGSTAKRNRYLNNLLQTKRYRCKGKMLPWYRVNVVEHIYSLTIPLETIQIGACGYSGVKTGFLVSAVRFYGHPMKLDVPLGVTLALRYR